MMKKTFLFSIALLAIISVLFTSCGTEKYPGYTETDSGLFYKFHVQNNVDSLKPVIGDILTLEMNYSSGDSVLFNSADLSGPFQLPLQLPTFQGDFSEGLAMMSDGDSATFIVSADSIYLKTFKFKTLPDFIDSGSVLYFNIKFINSMSQEEAMKQYQARIEKKKNDEALDLLKYIEDNNITVVPNESGMYYIETVKGKGKKAGSGKKVKVHYTGTLLDGTKFDSSFDHPDAKPIEFTLGQGQVIKGWDEGIGMMRVGGKATLVIPSVIAYGERGRGNIPPYAPLVFEVELVGVE
ncbi:MAG: FKBP-type peptidyl-prolyl cis-trans isomerase [Bacteroidales bacterium]|nr:FKBP-type peptidyl-prolyl cis-trans isomerase [Bacteroidales bacterium]